MMTPTDGLDLRAPFPWFGGKSRMASMVWQRFGTVNNYVEPFAGSLAVLLGRPNVDLDRLPMETVNDKDCFVANFWRALAANPEEVWHWADWPVNEADLHARHIWLVNRQDFRDRMNGDPDYYDAKVAGWWVWGISAWIGSTWCSGDGPWNSLDGRITNIKESGDAGQGVHRQRPHLGDAGQGVHRQLPHLGDAGPLTDLARRLRRVRVCCGDWSRILGPSPTTKMGLTAVLLDPPYSDELRKVVYAVDSYDVAHDVFDWAITHGDDPLLRIALCGYEGNHDMPSTWECVAWKTQGGYGGQGDGQGKLNAHRERVWFSPHCLGSQSSKFELSPT